MAQRFAQELGAGLGGKLGELGEADGSAFAGVFFVALCAGGVVLQNTDGFGDVALLDEFADVGLHIARRNAPCFVGEKNGALAAFGNGSPELAVENFAVG